LDSDPPQILHSIFFAVRTILRLESLPVTVETLPQVAECRRRENSQDFGILPVGVLNLVQILCLWDADCFAIPHAKSSLFLFVGPLPTAQMLDRPENANRLLICDLCRNLLDRSSEHRQPFQNLGFDFRAAKSVIPLP
jgi:hypothetical protein